MKKDKILLVNQSTSHLFRGLCERLKRRFPESDVFVLAGSYEPNEEEEIVTVLKGPLLVRHPTWRRLLSWSAFTLRFLGVILRHRFKLIVVTTNPPFCPWLLGLVNVIMRRPYLFVVYDIYPDVLARMGTLNESSFVYRFLKGLNVRAMRRASAVVSLGDDMVEHLRKQCGSNPPAIEMITSWADVEVYRPMKKEDNPFAKQYGLVDKFVVMYSGAFGATHDMDSILAAASDLRDVSEIRFVLIGKGTRYDEIEKQIRSLDLPNVILLGWQPLAVVPSSLAAADCHIVTLDALYNGISFPSKFYTSIAVGAAVLAVAEPETDLAKIVTQEQVGVTIRPQNPALLTTAVKGLMEDPERLKEMGERGRALAVSSYDEKVCTEQYLRLVGGII